jgi:hypothetical protein
MTKPNDVTSFLRPNGGWVQVGSDYEGITFVNCEPFTKEEYEAAFAQYDVWKAEQEVEQAAAKAAAEAKLAALGLTSDDLRALGF